MACFGQCTVSYRFHAERAIDIITHILPEDHLLLASSKRVKGEESVHSVLGFCVKDKQENVRQALGLIAALQVQGVKISSAVSSQVLASV